MKPIKRKYKPTIVCDKCHKSIGKTKPSYKKVGEIEYRYWRCRHCSTVCKADGSSRRKESKCDRIGHRRIKLYPCIQEPL